MSGSLPLSLLSGCPSPSRSTFWGLLDIFLYVSAFFILSVVFNDFVAAKRTLLGSIAIYGFGFVSWTV